METILGFILKIMLVMFILKTIYLTISKNDVFRDIVRTLINLAIFIVKVAKKIVLLSIKLIIHTYSFVVLLLSAKRGDFNYAEYWHGFTCDTSGVTFNHISGCDALFIEHHTIILKSIAIIAMIKEVIEKVVFEIINILNKDKDNSK